MVGGPLLYLCKNATKSVAKSYFIVVFIASILVDRIYTGMAIKDPKTLQLIKTAHPLEVDRLTAIYEECCNRITNNRVQVRFLYVTRTFAEQAELYAIGRTKPGQPCKCNGIINKIGTCHKHPLGLTVTKANAGQSYHNYGVAADAALFIDTNGDGKFDLYNQDLHKDYDGDAESDFMEIVYTFKLYGYEAGIEFKSFVDPPHFQKTYGLSVMEMKRRHDNKIFYNNTNYIKLS